MGRCIDGRSQRVKINDQNMIFNITAIIMSGFSWNEIRLPCVEKGPVAINAQFSFSPHPDNDLMMFMFVLMSGYWKFQKFRIEH